MAKITDFDDKEVFEIRQGALSMNEAAQHYYSAYKRGLAEGKRIAKQDIAEAKTQLKKQASTTPGPVFMGIMNWLNALESKY